MLDYITHYPIGYYLKTLSNPRKKAVKIGLYLSKDSSMLLLKSKDSITYWNRNIKDIAGGPSIEGTYKNQEKSKNQIPSEYKKEIQKELGLDKTNEVSIVIDDPEAYTLLHTVKGHEDVSSLESALQQDPGSIITAWKNYNTSSDYIWEILTPGMNILRGGMKLPKKVVLCGFPEARVLQCIETCEQNNQELINLIPTVPAVLSFMAKNGPMEGIFLLIGTANEVSITYLENKEIKILFSQKTKEGFTSDELADLQDYIEEAGQTKNVTIYTWGIIPGSPVHARLTTRYPNAKALLPEELRGLHPLEEKGLESPITDKEAWLLNNSLE